MIYIHGNRKRKEIALTFDDGPSDETPSVLAMLKKYDVRATFFIVGKMVSGREHVIALIKHDGHEFGNHTWSHERMICKSVAYITDDIKKCDDALARVEVKTNLLRFPELKCGPSALLTAKRLGKQIMFTEFFGFDQSVYDWHGPWMNMQGKAVRDASERVVAVTLARTKNGSILNFHDYLQGIGPHPELPSILERIIPALKEKGFTFVTVSELIAKR